MDQNLQTRQVSQSLATFDLVFIFLMFRKGNVHFWSSSSVGKEWNLNSLQGKVVLKDPSRESQETHSSPGRRKYSSNTGSAGGAKEEEWFV